MRYFLVSEFLDDGKTIDLISIGIVSEDGREYYAQSVEFDVAKASDWVRYHVLSQLQTCSVTGKWSHDRSLYSWQRCEKPDCPWRTREEIRDEIKRFLDPVKYGVIEIWGYYASYDWIVFCQLFGKMINLPEGYPMLPYDLRQWLDFNDLSHVHQEDDNSLHHALKDARWIAQTYKRCVGAK